MATNFAASKVILSADSARSMQALNQSLICLSVRATLRSAHAVSIVLVCCAN